MPVLPVFGGQALEALSTIASMNAANGPGQIAKTNRSCRACDACRRKKIRCSASANEDGTSPAAPPSDQISPSPCTNCLNAGQACLFTDSPGKRGPSTNKDYILQLERRLAALESGALETIRNEGASSHCSDSPMSESARSIEIGIPRLVRTGDTDALESAGAGSYAVPFLTQEAPTPCTADLQPSPGVSKATQPVQKPLPSISRLLNWAPEPVSPDVAPAGISAPVQTYAVSATHEMSPRLPVPSSRQTLPTLITSDSGLNAARHRHQAPQTGSADSQFGRLSARSASSKALSSGPYSAYIEKRSQSSRSKRSHSDTASSGGRSSNSVKSSPPSGSLSAMTSSPNELPSLLGRLTLSSIFSLDTPVLREALSITPALQTFAILSASRVESGFSGSSVAIKAAVLLASSSGHTAQDYTAWMSDIRQVIGEAFSPLSFGDIEESQNKLEVEALLMCYLDSIRRAAPMAALLNLIGTKLAASPCPHLAAVYRGITVWHSLAFATDLSSGCADLSSDEDTTSCEGTHQVVAKTTATLRRLMYPQDSHGDSPKQEASISLAHWSLQAVLRCFVSVLRSMSQAVRDRKLDLVALETQLRQLQQICAEIVTSGAAQLFVGPHIVALASCATVYSITELGSTQDMLPPDERQRRFSLQRDFVGVLESLKQLTRCMSVPLEASQLQSQVFATPGDMRPLYHSIATYIDVQTAAMQAGSESLTPSQVIATFQKRGYLGVVLAAAQKGTAA